MDPAHHALSTAVAAAVAAGDQMAVGRPAVGMGDVRMGLGPMVVPGGAVGMRAGVMPAMAVGGGAAGMRPAPTAALGAAAAAAALGPGAVGGAVVAGGADPGTAAGVAGGAATAVAASAMGGGSAPLESQSVGDVLKLLPTEMQEKIRQTLIRCLEEHESVSRIERVAKESARKQFFKAIYDRDYDLVHLLLCGSRSTYIDANLICPEDRWPALHACLYKYNQYPPEETIKIVRLLLDKGADISKPCPEGAVAINVLDKKPLPNGTANGPDNPKREKKTVSFQNKQVVDVAIDFLQAYKWAGCRQTVLNNWKPLIELLDQASMRQREASERCFNMKYSMREPDTIPVDGHYAGRFLKMLESGVGSDCTITCTYRTLKPMPTSSKPLSLGLYSAGMSGGGGSSSLAKRGHSSMLRSIDDDEDMDGSPATGIAMAGSGGSSSSSDVAMSVGLSGGMVSGSVPELSGRSGASMMGLDSFGDESKSSGAGGSGSFSSIVATTSSEIVGLDEPGFDSAVSSSLSLGYPGCGPRSGPGFFCTTTSSLTELGVVWKTSFSVHRSILMANSPVFEHMFQHEMVESISSEVLMSDTPPDAVRIVIYFMYSGRLNEELLLLPDSTDASSAVAGMLSSSALVASSSTALGSSSSASASGRAAMPAEETRDEDFDVDSSAARGSDASALASTVSDSRVAREAGGSSELSDPSTTDAEKTRQRRSNIGLALSALCLAEKYRMDELKQHLEYHLHSRINRSNSLEVLTAAHTHNALRLRRVALSYVCDHFAELSKESSFAVFSKEYPSLLQQVLEIVTKECMRTTPAVSTSHSAYRVLSKSSSRIGSSAYTGLAYDREMNSHWQHQ